MMPFPGPILLFHKSYDRLMTIPGSHFIKIG